MSPNDASRALRSAGIVLLAGAALAGVAAWLHMRAVALAYGVICGGEAGALAHCAACYAALGLLSAGIAALVLSARLARPSLQYVLARSPRP